MHHAAAVLQPDQWTEMHTYDCLQVLQQQKRALCGVCTAGLRATRIPCALPRGLTTHLRVTHLWRVAWLGPGRCRRNGCRMSNCASDFRAALRGPVLAERQAMRESEATGVCMAMLTVACQHAPVVQPSDSHKQQAPVGEGSTLRYAWAVSRLAWRHA